VVIVPGMTSTALEVWRGTGCYEDATRQRVWSSGGSTATFLLDPECLQRHLGMNGSTREDPDGVFASERPPGFRARTRSAR